MMAPNKGPSLVYQILEIHLIYLGWSPTYWMNLINQNPFPI
ncbi:hypothetical protein scyTo_0013886, partial [Scyliorhinus torazame]|nr:hypothetical protein [Scyliorhinus torazame]